MVLWNAFGDLLLSWRVVKCMCRRHRRRQTRAWSEGHMHGGSRLGSRGVDCQSIQRSHSASTTMPFIPLEEDEQAKALKGGRADVKWLMADNE
eukprot:7421741-Karenia_brevis.AAC.1